MRRCSPLPRGGERTVKFRGRHHSADRRPATRQMNSPEAYIHFTQGLINDGGQVTVESAEKFLHGQMAEFHAFVRGSFRFSRPTLERVALNSRAASSLNVGGTC